MRRDFRRWGHGRGGNGMGLELGKVLVGVRAQGRRKERRATWRPAELGRVKDAIHAQRLGRLAR
jgi:hypothetical protein